MNFFSCSLVVFFLIIGAQTFAQPTEQVLPELKNNLDQSYSNFDNVALQNQTSKSYDSLVRALAIEVPSGATFQENTLDNKLLAIAQYLKRFPERFQEIKNTYILGVDDYRFRVPSSPQVSAAHASEDYRLVWEYYLLKPYTNQGSNLYKQRINEALARINNPKSLFALQHAYAKTSGAPSRYIGTLVAQKTLMINTLARMPSEASLSTMLEVVSSDLTTSKDSIAYWDANKYLKEVLSDTPILKKYNWNSIINSFNTTRLNPSARQLYDQIKSQN
ncbi:hypothetical protein D9O36_08110 [Zobellia amurskyensis]|uniref:Uncharacterized protein n=1 Tax=Zobellia amurskyensis TaxID=248905 RepID=A0A7X2ZSZ2_9FLAO|nr:hypothetical protein [Zobellia amurskyensis]MUH35799.1 hypothetical protein [Zobellia amurskyensis]